MQLSHILAEKDVLSLPGGRDKKQLLKHLTYHVSQRLSLAEREIYGALLEREQQGATAVGAGVAIPHARLAGVEAPFVVFAKLNHAVTFGASDKQPVDILFLLLSPEGSDREHLKALSLLSKMLRDKLLMGRLRNAPDTSALYALLISHVVVQG